jgi:hypothetical protein
MSIEGETRVFFSKHHICGDCEFTSPAPPNTGLSRKIRTQIITLLLLSCSATVKADESFEPLKTTAQPQIDGILNEEIWRTSRGFTDFITYMPDFDKPDKEKTVAYITYDDENVYFAFNCYDRKPNKIKTSIAARDKIRADDWVCINLDSNNDQQVLYTFYINPNGIQMDARHVGMNEDLGVDLVWESAGTIDDEGYNVEIRIPFKSLRYSREEPVQMGVILERRISRYSSQATYPARDPTMGIDFLLHNLKLNFHDIKHYTLFELLPAVTYSNTKIAREGGLKTDLDRSEVSLTSKLGISSDLIADFTYNPDCSQVEADAGQVEENQRYALYYPEKRSFFLEGNEHYGFAGSEADDPLKSIVHTRQIVDPEVGAKLAGKIGSRNHLATMYALDELPDEDTDDCTNYAHFSILRYKRSFQDDNYLGVFYTGREEEKNYNRLAGTDGKVRLSKSSFIGYHGIVSFTKDSTDEKTGSERAAGITYRYSTRDTDLELGIHDITDNFQTRTGYVTRTGITRARIFYGPKYYPSKGSIKKFGPLFTGNITRDKPSKLDEYTVSPGLQLLLTRNSHITARYNYSTEIYLNRKFRTSGFSVETSSQIFKQLFVSLQYSGGKKIRYAEDPYQAKGNTLTSLTIFQPVVHFSTELSYTYSDLYGNETGEKVFDYHIVRSKNTYQINKYLFLRVIVEYDSYNKDLLSDYLVSFTYIPGTVIHFGYGAMYEKTRWNRQEYIESNDFLETKRGFFFKGSYLLRL